MAKKKKPIAEKQPESKPGSEQRSGFPLLRVALVFCSLVLAFHVGQWLLNFIYPTYAFEQLTAATVARGISLVGINCSLNGTVITLPNAVWQVVMECTALTAVVVFVSFIIAFPATWRSRGIGIGIGVPFILVANVVRLVTLAWLTQKIPRSADFVHDYIWQVVFLFLVVLMWIAWLSLVVNREQRPQVSG